MDWNTVAGYYRGLLPRVLEVHQRTRELASLPQTQAPAGVCDALARLAQPLERQLDRLQRNEFRIAVVGLEKAGKSTFVNAWLGYDLLPNDTERCTYTTTQVFSVAEGEQQRLEVDAKTPEQFRQMESQLRALAGGTDERALKARNDLEAIDRHRPDLQRILEKEKGRLSQPFTRLEDVAGTLKSFVADPRHVYAVLEARLYTQQLARMSGIVFYDVPGLNSGLTIHEEQAERMLADCDAVILVQRAGAPSIEASEQKLVRFIQEGDEKVRLADKLFVFLARIDQEGTEVAVKENRAKAEAEWLRVAQLPPERLVSGSAAAFLLLHNQAGDHLRRYQNADVVKAALARLTGARTSEELEQATGIPLIRDRVEHYLHHERAAVLRKRCEGPIEELMRTARQMFDRVRQRYPEDPDEARRLESEEQRIRFSKWWERHWEESILSCLQQHCEDLLHGEGAAGVNNLRERYAKLIGEGMRALPSRQDKVRDNLFRAHSMPEFQPADAGSTWRARLFGDITELIESVSEKLAVELQQEAARLVEYMRDELLWSSTRVPTLLIGQYEEYRQRLAGKLQTLFLRFARPVAEILIRWPLANPARRARLKVLGPDAELLDNYYQGDEPAYRQLKLFAKYGRYLLVHKGLREQKLGVATATQDQITTPDISHLPCQAERPDDVKAEVEADLNALETYFLQAVFTAAGFAAFREQELGALRDQFSRCKGVWSGEAENQRLAGNSRLLGTAGLPDELKRIGNDTEVSARLRQLRIALDQTHPLRDGSTKTGT
jgi:hypothetical protein